VEIAAQRFAQFRGQGGNHDTNLQDTLVRAAEESDQRLMRILAQDTQTGIGRARGPKHGIGTPRQRLGEPGLYALGVEIMS